jgi:hypothetical protein
VESTTGSAVEDLLPDEPTSVRAMRRGKAGTRPSVGDWLGAFQDAEYIVTDSFHGTVFAILHHKPFFTIVNNGRGAARFESLLHLFDMRDRLIQRLEDLETSDITAPACWDHVDAIIARERERAMVYLREQLAGLSKT